MIGLEFTSSKRRILDFDIENRPLSYLGQDFTTAQITAIAWAWIDDPEDIDFLYLDLGQEDIELDPFIEAFDQADIVTGHYIREHDLPIINANLLEYGSVNLGPKMTQDTKIDLTNVKYLSKSQESLAAMFGLEAPKIHMTQEDWRQANRLTEKGIRKTVDRVVGDVKQHMELRNELLRIGALGPGQVWRP